jgi:hypothetical protein
MTGSSRSEKDDGSKQRCTARRARRSGHGIRGGSSEASRLAVAILEVLAGVNTPADAAAALKISLPRYYVLEKRALDGLVAACEPKPSGKQPSPETRIAALEKALKKAERECARQQALVRVARRSVGLSATMTPSRPASKKRDRRGRKRRPATVRALKAAETLRNRLASAEAPGVEPEVLNPAAVVKEDVHKEGTSASS